MLRDVTHHLPLTHPQERCLDMEDMLDVLSVAVVFTRHALERAGLNGQLVVNLAGQQLPLDILLETAIEQVAALNASLGRNS